MEQMINKNEFDEKIEWEASREAIRPDTELEEEVESLFNVVEIEAV